MWGRYSTQRGACAALALALTGLPGAQAAHSSWLDIEGRIQYAYYTEDLRSLANLTDTLASSEDEDGLRDYYNGFAYYRMALLATTRDPDRKGGVAASSINTANAAERCVVSLDRVLERRADFVEALALQAACLDALGQLKPLRAPLAESRGRAYLAKAVRLAPANPRVLLIKASGTQTESALKQAIAAFEAERQGLDKVPGWGAAEAYMQLGRYYLDRQNVLAARDALERALLIAPEFAAARRLLAHITSG